MAQADKSMTHRGQLPPPRRAILQSFNTLKRGNDMKLRILSKLAVIGALTASFAGPAAGAGAWILAADSAEGDVRFLVDVQRFDYSVNKHGTHVFSAPVRMVKHGATEEGVVAIDGAGCLGAGGEMIFSLARSTKRYWWAVGGNRVYDGVGSSLCGIAAALMEQAQRERSNSASPSRENRTHSF
jgi:hypothetical protein